MTQKCTNSAQLLRSQDFANWDEQFCEEDSDKHNFRDQTSGDK